MKPLAYHILRLGLGITFVWIGILILRDPEAWSGYIQPWVIQFMPLSPERVMIGAGIIDIIVGLMLVVNLWIWLAGLLGAMHLVGVLTASGINAITVRDIGLLGACTALAINYWPKNFFGKNKTDEIL